MGGEVRWTRGQADVLECSSPTTMVEQNPAEFKTCVVQVQKVLRVQVGKDLEDD